MQHAEQRADRQARTKREPGIERLPRPAVHPDLTAPAAFSVPDEDRATDAIQVALGQRERFADPQPGTPSTTMTPRSLTPSGSSPAARMTAMISSTVGGPVDTGALCCEAVGRGDTRAGLPATGAAQRNPRVERIP